MTFGEFKAAIRQRLWPTGEAPNLVIPHTQDMIDCLIDLQTWVDCMQQDNTDLIPHCATTYNCGLTVFPGPRGNIKALGVIDKIDQETGKEDPEGEDDYCRYIKYSEVDYCHVKAYLARSNRIGCCLSIPAFFGIDGGLCQKANFPVPTDDGVPKNLPVLPLGFHYAQTSTDRTHGRARAGVWAKHRGNIYIAPWIQSTETVQLTWDGLKRAWADNDPIDEDPLLQQAVLEYCRWKNADKWEKDPEEAARAQAAYCGSPVDPGARAMLIHQCREETRIREECEPSHARSSPSSIGTLFYNSEQRYTARCGDGTSGDDVSVTILAGTVASNISVADADQRARDEAQSQAESRLDCATDAPEFANDAQTATATCATDSDSPSPEGTSVTITIPAGTVISNVSKSDANQQAKTLAENLAESQLSCTYWNSEQSFTATCTDGSNPVTKTVAAHTYSSNVSQADANNKARTQAQTNAESALTGCSGQTYTNTLLIGSFTQNGCRGNGALQPTCSMTAEITVLAGTVSSTISQADANQRAHSFAVQYAQQLALQQCLTGHCGLIERNWP